jgi:hypothetical protein
VCICATGRVFARHRANTAANTEACMLILFAVGQY